MLLLWKKVVKVIVIYGHREMEMVGRIKEIKGMIGNIVKLNINLINIITTRTIIIVITTTITITITTTITITITTTKHKTISTTSQ